MTKRELYAFSHSKQEPKTNKHGPAKRCIQWQKPTSRTRSNQKLAILSHQFTKCSEHVADVISKYLSDRSTEDKHITKIVVWISWQLCSSGSVAWPTVMDPQDRFPVSTNRQTDSSGQLRTAPWQSSLVINQLMTPRLVQTSKTKIMRGFSRHTTWHVRW